MLRRLESGADLVVDQRDRAARPPHGARPAELRLRAAGPVYTPPEERGQGYASAAVAALSQHVLDSGATPCLFTDQANPTSNAIYQRLGYRPLADMANLVIGPRGPTEDGMPGGEHPAYLQTD